VTINLSFRDNRVIKFGYHLWPESHGHLLSDDHCWFLFAIKYERVDLNYATWLCISWSDSSPIQCKII